MTEQLTLDTLLRVAGRAISGDVLVRGYGLLESALARPRATVFGEEAYPTLIGKAAALLHSLARNHALVDGNERLAWLATATFLWINGHTVDADDDILFDLVIAVSSGELDDVAGITDRLSGLVVPR
ncbi:toxin Doc [Pseudonocardia sulfidoxydans NBRC 16205]|uniref:Toxin Doc n=1 Tax=Pseudonocardia sulfidoxydans NBRC 16205 TaxID=1223511 RepID=A0A511DCV9_9PSEU|nr:Fic family protein [Pseudonocardia sulfidoxydans]GEL22630.1 toxin Doc [Pseudonocardia sulfidoxydans NBRC 16205]